MRNSVQLIYKESQYLSLFKNKCNIRSHLIRRKLNKYSQVNSHFNLYYTTRYSSHCLLQGRVKRVLKIFGFNRHLIRSACLKKQYNNLSTLSW